MKKLSVFLFAMVLVFFWSTSALAMPEYHITDLGLGTTTAINNQGQVVGDPGIGDLDWGNGGRAYGINDYGKVVGISASAPQHAFFWGEESGSIDLGTLVGSSGTSAALAINNSNQVIGYSYTESGYHAFLWDESNGLHDLGTLGGIYSRAHGINNFGKVVGSANDGDNTHAFVWDSLDGMKDLGTLSGGWSVAQDINDLMQIVGSSNNQAFYWDTESGMIPMGNFGGNSYSFSINNSGEAVGQAVNSVGESRAFIWDKENGMRDLNEFVNDDNWPILDYASAINDSGQIVGYSNFNGEAHAFLLTPIPEPTIDAILDFFDESVEDGTLEGRGRGWLAKLRLCLMRQLLVIAGEFIEHDRLNKARFLLQCAHKRCDGEPWPRDFVEGPATEELAEMIVDLMENL